MCHFGQVESSDCSGTYQPPPDGGASVHKERHVCSGKF